MRRAWMPPESALMSTCGASGRSAMERCCAENTATSSRNAVWIWSKIFSVVAGFLTSKSCAWPQK